jgi:hypothetical protein
MNVETKRFNRAEVEWKQFFTPHEYVLLDQILFRGNLTFINEGKGYIFHVRTMAEESGISVGKCCRIIQGWSFMEKKGEGRSMEITLNYAAFFEWIKETIVHRVNNDRSCSEQKPLRSPGEPKRSIIKEDNKLEVNSTVLCINSGETVSTMNENKSTSTFDKEYEAFLELASKTPAPATPSMKPQTKPPIKQGVDALMYNNVTKIEVKAKPMVVSIKPKPPTFDEVWAKVSGVSSEVSTPKASVPSDIHQEEVSGSPAV